MTRIHRSLRCAARSLAGSALVLAGVQAVQAQAPVRVQWSMRSQPTGALVPGSAVEVTLIAAIDTGWHMYSLTQESGGPIALDISVPAGEPFVLAGRVSGPRPHIEHDSSLGIQIELHSGITEFTVPLRLVAASATGAVEGRIVARFQTCSDNICLPPRSVTVPVRLTASASSIRGR